jgi:hypothetical protein
MAKYIVHTRGIMPESMVIFDHATPHVEMVEMLHVPRECIVSAGRVKFVGDTAYCDMESESLGIRRDEHREEKDRRLANVTFDPLYRE